MSKQTINNTKNVGFTLLARPKQRLSTHISNMLREVSKINKRNFTLFRQKIESADLSQIETFFINNLILSHDFGKINPFFQDKLRKVKYPDKKRTLTYHSQLSGLFCWLLGSKARDIYQENEIDEREFNLHLVSITFAIFNHHNLGKLPNTINSSIRKYGTHLTYEDLGEIITEINKRYFESYLDTELIDYIDSKIVHNEIDIKRENPVFDFVEKFFEENPRFNGIVEETISNILELTDVEDIEFVFDEMEELWDEVCTDNRLTLLILYYYSLLCDLDEWDAKSHIEDSEEHFMNFENKKVPLERTIIEEYRKKNFAPIDEKTEDELLKLKQNLWEKSSETLEKLQEENIISVTYPTGSGKTLTFLNLAFNLRYKMYEKSQIIPRIIYCLPFISITDQVGETLRNILLEERKAKQSDLLTIHHHLAEAEWSYFSEDEEKDEYNIKSYRDYIYLWNSNIIVTTFVSFWNSLLGGKKRNVLRFHRIAGSIIIFDEIQSIPIKYWQLISTLIHQLTEVLGCKVILGSATNPKAISYPYVWNKYRGKLCEINFNEKKANLDRYTIYFSKKRQDLVEFGKEAVEFLAQNKEKSVMFVLNTKESARLLFDYLVEKFPKEPIYFLSSVVTHEDRKKIIEKLKEKRKKRILVCTQVIEAGIDVTFDIVYRDMAPLDSIIQVAGRCNRYNERKGVVKIVELVKPGTENAAYYKMIYDTTMIWETRKVLEKYDKIEENEIGKIINEYYDKLTLIGEKKATNLGVDELNNTEIENLTEIFRLIEEKENETLIILGSSNEYQTLLKRVDSSKGKAYLYDYRTKALSLTKKQKKMLKEKISDHYKLFIISSEEEGEILGYVKEPDDPFYSENGGLNIPLLYNSKRLSEYE